MTTPMRQLIAGLTILCTTTLVSGLPAADLQVATVFTDHMVLQQQKPVAVWGQAPAGHQIHVRFGEQAKQTSAGHDGHWKLTLDPLPASSKPHVLTITDRDTDEQLQVSDVLVGEVWLGSGQSNMAMQVRRALNPEQEAATADLPLIRLFTEGSTGSEIPQNNSTGSWQVCTPETASAFSATLFFFGREIHSKLQVPIGLMNSSVGGTPIESWISGPAQQNTPALSEHFIEQQAAYDEFDFAAAESLYQRQMQRYQQRLQAGETGLRRPRNASEARNRRGPPGGLFNGKIHPLIPFGLRGIVWYQGENNANSQWPELYQHQLPTLVRDWRARWGDELPFVWVQLPNYTASDVGWPEVREGMRKALEVPQTGMAITIDIGEEKDIHPKNKQDVGRRLSWWALADVYDQKVPAASGPLPAACNFTTNSVEVTFRYPVQGLQTSDQQAVRGFELQDADGIWHPATAELAGDRAVIRSKNRNAPAAVRYAWAALPDCNLVNSAGLPASPFRQHRHTP